MNRRSFWTALALLWLSGACLRLTILAVPPVLPVIRSDFALSATQIGVLSSIPVALFGLAAVPGSLLIARLGTRTTLAVGLLVAALGGALRVASFNLWVLYAATAVMGFGVAVMQPVLPAVVREWLPRRIGFGTAVYANGLLAGETFPVLLMLPVVMVAVGGDWRWALGVWSVPVLITAALVLLAAPPPVARVVGGLVIPPPAVPMQPTPMPRPRWWPDWRSGLMWELGALLGTVNSMYFATNAFLPSFLNSTGRPQLISGALSALNFSQIPSSLLLLAAASWLERRAWPYVLAGLLTLSAAVGMVSAAGAGVIFWAGVLGFAGSAVLTLGLTLPALLYVQADVPRVSAAMFTIGYASAMAVAVICGAAWDHTGVPAMAFLPIGLCAVVLTGLGVHLRLGGHLR